MVEDRLASARAALAAGQHRRAVDLGWRAVHPAALSNDTATLEAIRDVAERVAADASGRPHEDALQLVAYCDGCIAEPQEPPLASLFGLFGGRRRSVKRCPDCAEDIKADARVCRFCGYRYPLVEPRDDRNA